MFSDFKEENRVSMAGYKQHITFSGFLGVGYGTASVLLFGFTPEQGILAGVLTWIAGMLPDLDSQTGRPVNEIFGLLAAIVPFEMMGHLLEWGGNPEGAMAYAVGIYAAIRYGGSYLLGKLSVHRGMFHSIPAMIIAAEIAFLGFKSDSMITKGLMAGGVGLGFLSHLVLDEIYSVQWNGMTVRLKKSSGTAIKMIGKRFAPNIVTYSLLMVLTYASLVSVGIIKDPAFLPGKSSTPILQHATEDFPDFE